MRKLMSVLLCLCLALTLAAPVMAATVPAIVRQPQNPTFPEYGVAEYSVTVYGENLKCTWFLRFDGVWYDISTPRDSAAPWEGYAGETYGAVQSSEGMYTTFTYFFGGIDPALSGCTIYAVIEDGHYSLTSDEAFITVSGNAYPPTTSVAAGMEVYQGEGVSLYCEASDPEGGSLSYVWYETSSGRLQDMIAMNRGAETGDTLYCDTSSTGTRYYLCMVTTSGGGSAYTSVIPVTVIPRDTNVQIPVLMTANSAAEPGGKLTVDLEAMANYDAWIYNAWLERSATYQWYKNGSAYSQKSSVSFTQADVGSTWYVLVTCGDLTLKSDNYTVLSVAEPPVITTTALPDATAGEFYNTKLSCTDGDAVFTAYYNPGKANDLESAGLYITQHGEIEGTPTEAGTYSFTICASGEGGEGYQTFTLTVLPPETTESTETTGEKSQGNPKDKFRPGEADDSEAPTTEPEEPAPEASGGMPWWAVLLIALAATGAGVGVTVFILTRKKR